MPVSGLRESPSGQGRGAHSPLCGSLDCPTGQGVTAVVERSQAPVTGFLGRIWLFKLILAMFLSFRHQPDMASGAEMLAGICGSGADA